MLVVYLGLLRGGVVNELRVFDHNPALRIPTVLATLLEHSFLTHAAGGTVGGLEQVEGEG